MSDPENANPTPTATGPLRIGRTLTIDGRTVTVRLDPATWQALDEVCQRQEQTADEVVAAIDRQRGNTGLVPALRNFLTRHFKDAADRDRPRRGLSEADDGPLPISPLMSRALDSIGPPPKPRSKR